MNQQFGEIVVVGCGVVGLPLAVALASRGQRVVGIDVDAARVEALRRGAVVGGEEALATALASALASRTLCFDTALQPTSVARAYVIAVSTPADADGRLDESALENALDSMADVLNDGDLIMVRSTVPIGTTRKIAARLGVGGRTVRLAATPDRSLAGRSLADQFSVPHIVGGVDEIATGQALRVLGSLGRVIDAGSAETAEAIKLFANVQRDVTFALANELAMICEALDLDFHRIRRLGGLDYERFSVARPGPVGGPCLTKDIHLLAASLPSGQRAPELGLAGRRTNVAVVDHVARLAETVVDCTRVDPPTIAVLGLTFKGTPVTSEQRGSFGLSFIERMQSRRPRVAIRRWDPVAAAESPSVDDVVRGTSVVVLATEHRILRELDPAALGRLMTPPGMIIDLWGDHRPAIEMPDGIVYHAFGTGRVRPTS